MPRGDKTGPEGKGSMTGRRLGSCTGDNPVEFNSSNFRFGRKHRRGMRSERSFGNRSRLGNRFYNRGFSNPIISERSILENEIKSLKEQIENYEARLSQLEQNN